MRLIALEMGLSEVEHWKPEIECQVSNVKLEVTHINTFLERQQSKNPYTKVGIFTESASERLPIGDQADGPNGHRDVKHYRDLDFGKVYTQTQSGSRV